MNKYRTEIKWGLIFTAMMILWMIGERLTGLHGENIDQHAIWTNAILVPALTIYWLALRDKRENSYGGKMTWAQGFKAGAIITAVVTVLTPLTQWLTSAVISPDYFANAIEYGVSSGTTTQEAAEAFFNMKNYIIMSFIGSIVMGLVSAAIIALFVRRK
jgi:hypothetical protein